MTDQYMLLRQMRRCGHLLYHRYSSHNAQNRVLLMLSRNGTMTQNEVSERMHIRPASMSELAAKLEKAGYLSRERDAEDRRHYALSLTDAGRTQAGIAEDAQRALAARLFACLSDGEQASLAGILDKLTAEWGTMCGCAPVPQTETKEGQ